jgi:hypothetical protein
MKRTASLFDSTFLAGGILLCVLFQAQLICVFAGASSQNLLLPLFQRSWFLSGCSISAVFVSYLAHLYPKWFPPAMSRIPYLPVFSSNSPLEERSKWQAPSCHTALPDRITAVDRTINKNQKFLSFQLHDNTVRVFIFIDFHLSREMIRTRHC